MFKRLLIVFLFISFNSFSQPADSTNISIIDSKDLRGGVWLVSKWQFQNADPKIFNEQQHPSPSAVWQGVSLDSLKKFPVLIPDFKGTGWFRIYIRTDTSVYQQYLGFKLLQEGASELYINSKLISKQGRFSTPARKGYSVNSDKQFFFTVPDSRITEVLIKYENTSLIETDKRLNFGKYLGVQISDYHVAQSRDGGKTTYTVLFTLLFTIFFIHFILFLFYTKNFSNLYYAIFTLALSILCLKIIGVQTAATVSLGDSVFKSILMGIALIALSALFNYLFGKFKLRFWILSTIVLLGLILSRIFDYKKDNLVLILALVLVLAEAIYLTIRARKKNVPDTIILLIGMGVSIFSIAVAAISTAIWGDGVAATATLGLSVLLCAFSALLSITAFLASRIARTNDSLSMQLHKVEKLSNEKEHILKTQNEFLEQQVNERTSELQLEKEKSDNLLLNILPQEVAEELKNTGKTEAQHYDEVSVLFTDFVSFTSISEKLGVGELIHELNENFTAFDHIMEKHGLEKIKTIGDAYLAVSGLPNKNGNHAKAAILAALDILDYVEDRKKTSPYGLDIRIGIHSGPLVAGIVGVKKFAFDIWGDTVNTAARMEQNSESGRINISSGTYSLVQDEFNCEAREVISVKGKGEMEMYFVNSNKA